MAAESGAESAVAESLGGVRPKRWNIANKEGFQSWALRVNAFIASKPQYQSVVGVERMITVAEYTGFDPSFATASPATQVSGYPSYGVPMATGVTRPIVFVVFVIMSGYRQRV